MSYITLRLCWDKGHPWLGFSYSTVHWGNCWELPQFGQDFFFSNPFQFIVYNSSYFPYCVVRDSIGVVKHQYSRDVSVESADANVYAPPWVQTEL